MKLDFDRYRWVWATALAALAVIVLAGAWGLRRLLAGLPDVHSLDHYTPSLITKVYDVNGDLITELFIEKRSVVPLPQIPMDMRNAVLAIEDNDFYSHMGVDFKGIARALWAAVKARRFVQGASTITQQLARNVFLTHKRTLTRKVKELLLTLQMERTLSKDEILQMYLNQIYFGHGAYGLDSAARTFFNKPAQELTLPECALLAGLPKSPERYSPFRRTARAIRRRNLVLRRMREEGFITEAEQLHTAGAVHLFKRAAPPGPNAGYFIEMVRLQLEPKHGTQALYKGGLSIHTTLDMRMQKAAEAAFQKHLADFDAKYAEERLAHLLERGKLTQDFFDRWKAWREDPAANEEPENGPEPVPVQGALVAVDPHTGGIRALVGGRDFRESQFNRAVQAKRQPGSTFKPFVWLAALDAGMTAATIVDDYPIAYTDVGRQPRLVAEAVDYAQLMDMVKEFESMPREEGAPPTIWAPQNWDNKFLGPMTLRRGLALSRNLVSVRLTDSVGPRAVAETARRAGVKSPLDAVLSLGLGSSVVTPLDMAVGVATLANGGNRMEPYFVTRVFDRQGVLLEEASPRGDPSITPQSAYLITRLMQAVVSEGTGGHARRLGRPVAGKTGTTQDLRDVWFVGFAPDLATTVWIGYDDFVPLGKKLTSAGTSVPLWTDFMADSLRHLPNRDFAVPPGIVFSKIDRDTGYLALPTCPHVALEAFREDTAPTEFCPVDHDAASSTVSDEDITE